MATSCYRREAAGAQLRGLRREPSAPPRARRASRPPRGVCCVGRHRHTTRRRPAAPPPTRAAPPATVKIVLWDLDGTLWRGALEDDDRVEPRPAFVDAIGALADRGDRVDGLFARPARRPKACSTRWDKGAAARLQRVRRHGFQGARVLRTPRRCTCRRATRCSSTTRRATAPTS